MIQIKDKTYKVEIERKNIKNIYLRVEEGTLKITCSKRVAEKDIYAFINSKLDWIYKVTTRKVVDSKLLVGDFIYYWGKKYKFQILYGNKNMKVEDDTITIRCRKETVEDALNVFYELTKDEILDKAFMLEDDYLKILRDYGYIKEPIYKVKMLKSMWGCCYSKKNLVNLSSRLIHFDEKCLKAVLWHELLHFAIPNHSKRFHEVINYHMPEYNEIIKTLH